MNAASLDLMALASSSAPTPAAWPPQRETRPSPFASDCIAGLSGDPKSLPCKWLYDDVGSRLFERITALDEYYPSRTEETLLQGAATHTARLLTSPTTLMELGSGASRKTRLLLAASDAIDSYVPIDISADELARACTSLRADFPSLAIRPLCADFAEPTALELSAGTKPVLLFFPGSTLGNMAPSQAIEFLSALRTKSGADARLLLGVDLLKDERTLLAAYDDAAGITAAFNLNLLLRMNRELGSTIDVSAFRHRAIWNAGESRIEMHLEATSRQAIAVHGRTFMIQAGETIHTENSYKLSASEWRAIFETAGWRMEKDWKSPQPRFLLALLVAGMGEPRGDQKGVG